MGSSAVTPSTRDPSRSTSRAVLGGGCIGRSIRARLSAPGGGIPRGIP
jgi:hypothetical protein